MTVWGPQQHSAANAAARGAPAQPFAALVCGWRATVLIGVFRGVLSRLRGPGFIASAVHVQAKLRDKLEHSTLDG